MTKKIFLCFLFVYFFTSSTGFTKEIINKLISQRKAEKLVAEYLQKVLHRKLEKKLEAIKVSGNCRLIILSESGNWESATSEGCYHVDYEESPPNIKAVKGNPYIIISLDGKKIGLGPRE